ncbi:SDR family oxidoreductase [Ignavibacteria bacterium]|nr:SDR family oxidoreductase [Bacteroidota bacterium]MCZ2131968.1 SDR family oxidoreductase [Bacteroidota bacterium]
MLEFRDYALILGASSGFGQACAYALAEGGFNIIGVHLDRAATLPKVQETIEGIEQRGAKAIFFNTNAADAERRAEVVAAISSELAANKGASVKVMLHSLAFGTLLPFIGESPLQSATQKQVEMTLDVMANTLVYWTQALVFDNLLGEGSRIFALTSAGSRRVLPTYGIVSAAKAALESYVRQLALELAPHGITINAICAGVTDTPALRRIPGNDIIMKHAHMRNPHHRLTIPDDVAKVLALLVRPEAAWITGTTINVDGGEEAVDLTWWKNPRE